MASSEARREALCQLARMLCDDAAVVSEIELAWNDPHRYLAEHVERASGRGISAPTPELPFIALIDALIDRKRCHELDWKADDKEVSGAVRELLRSLARKRWKAPRLTQETAEEMLPVVGASLRTLGLSLCTLELGSDSYVLALLPYDALPAAREQAELSHIAGIREWTTEARAVEPPAVIRLRPVYALDVASSEPPRQFFALPGRRTATFDGSAITLRGPEGVARIELHAELLPDFDPNAPQHVLVRSGDAIGVVSRRFVRLWPSVAESVLYRNEPALPSNDRGDFPGAVTGGVSEDPGVVVAVFHRAHKRSDDAHPVVLRLDAPTGVARFEALNTAGRLGSVNLGPPPLSSAGRKSPRLAAIAWLDAALHVVASGTAGQGSPSYAFFGRYYPPYGNLVARIDLREECACRLSSSRSHVLASYPSPERPPAVCPLDFPSGARLLELPPGASLLDHEDDGFWYFEPTGGGGRYVFAEAT